MGRDDERHQEEGKKRERKPEEPGHARRTDERHPSGLDYEQDELRCRRPEPGGGAARRHTRRDRKPERCDQQNRRGAHGTDGCDQVATQAKLPLKRQSDRARRRTDPGPAHEPPFRAALAEYVLLHITAREAARRTGASATRTRAPATPCRPRRTACRWEAALGLRLLDVVSYWRGLTCRTVCRRSNRSCATACRSWPGVNGFWR